MGHNIYNFDKYQAIALHFLSMQSTTFELSLQEAVREVNIIPILQLGAGVKLAKDSLMSSWQREDMDLIESSVAAQSLTHYAIPVKSWLTSPHHPKHNYSY